jgi:CheY-like chemotaxis protein
LKAIPYFCIKLFRHTMDSTKPLKILIVDDDRDDQYMIRKIVSSLAPDAAIVQAYNGDECLRYLEAYAHDLPALITMDLNMPLVNGIEATSQIKTNPVAQHIPLVVLTTSDRASDKDAAMAAGANDYVVKPVVYDELQQAVRGIIGKWLR